jgi:hypothetical protein
MDHGRTAPLVGIAGAVAVVLALAYPYVAVDGTVGLYYGSGLVNPLVAGLLVLVSIIVLAAAREERTDPAFAAGVVLIFGAFATALLVLWATTVRIDAVEISPLHRWATAAVSLVVPVAGAWYARSLRVF